STSEIRNSVTSVANVNGCGSAELELRPSTIRSGWIAEPVVLRTDDLPGDVSQVEWEGLRLGLIQGCSDQFSQVRTYVSSARSEPSRTAPHSGVPTWKAG